MICFLICYVMFSSFSFYLFYYHYYYFFFPFFLFFYYTSCTLFPTNKPLHPQCRRLIILEYEGELYRVEQPDAARARGIHWISGDVSRVPQVLFPSGTETRAPLLQRLGTAFLYTAGRLPTIHDYTVPQPFLIS